MQKEYSPQELERLIVETTRRGAVYATLFFDAHGRDEEAVKNSLVDFVDRLSKEKGVLYCIGRILPAYSRPSAGEGSPSIFSTSAEVKMLAESFLVLHGVCLRYAPVGVEILEPNSIPLTLEQAHSLLLDASQTSQEYASYILKKVLPPEEFHAFEQKLSERTEAGRKLAEKK